MINIGFLAIATSALLSIKEPNNQTQHETNEQGSGERQIQSKVLSLNDNIARQSAKP